MILLGNYKDWIKPEWLDEILSTDGIAAPRDLLKKENMHSEDLRVKDAGYSIDKVYYNLFESDKVNFKLDIPGINKGKVKWWITRMSPGQMMPVHVDPRIGTVENVKRYWMPWTDWEQGHIFVYEDKVISNYRAGDLFLMPDSMAVHGAANVGLTTRITLNIGVVED